MAILSDITTAFLFRSNCAAPSPCHCGSKSIDCSWGTLSQIPYFTRQTGYTDSLRIIFSFNQITTISAGAFSNLSSINTTSIKLYFIGNNINQIQQQAFSGIENEVILLELSYNNLTHLPAGLGELTGLQTLVLEQNPITILDAPVLSNLGHTLKTLILDANYLYSLSNELHYLQRLNKLVINYIHFPRLNISAFDGLRSLTELEMSYSKLEKIPAAICHLTKLRSLTVSSSYSLSDNSSPVFESYKPTVPSVRTLILSNDSLTVFPNVFPLFPNLETLILKQNNIRFITSSSLQYNTSLTTLDLSNNKLVAFPTSVNMLVRLRDLILDSNQISSLEEFDLFQLHELTSIDLHRNPLKHVSPNAFKTNHMLYNIGFGYTNLTAIPAAVLPFKKVIYLLPDRIPYSVLL